MKSPTEVREIKSVQLKKSAELIHRVVSFFARVPDEIEMIHRLNKISFYLILFILNYFNFTVILIP